MTKIFSKKYLEPLFMLIIGLGLFFLCQPFSITLYSYGFVVLLAGTLGFIIVSHLRDS
ncbi:hypothetical protein JXJ21_03445 [candidate division KSB1 bacterium]|nr:hypothetical protein [candidate division KSB1 bacterium]